MHNLRHTTHLLWASVPLHICSCLATKLASMKCQMLLYALSFSWCCAFDQSFEVNFNSSLLWEKLPNSVENIKMTISVSYWWSELFAKRSLYLLTLETVCAWVTGPLCECRLSTNRLLWLSGSVTGGQHGSHPERRHRYGPCMNKVHCPGNMFSPKSCLCLFPRLRYALKSAAVAFSMFARKGADNACSCCLNCVCLIG